MPTLTISPTYSDGSTLTAAQIDSLVDPITTFVNTTKLDTVNVDIDDVVDNISSSEAGIILNRAGLSLNDTDEEEIASLSTTWVSVAAVTAPTDGTFLISIFGTLSSIESTTTATISWDGYCYGRVYHSANSAAIGPEFTIGSTLVRTATTVAVVETRVIDQGFSWNYITTVSASVDLTFQMYRDNNHGVSDSVVLDTYMTMTRSVQ